MRYEMGTIVAKRILKRPDGSESEVQVLIGQPVQRYGPNNDAQDWYCPVQIRGIGDDKVRAAFGEDSLQALYFALILAGQMIKASVPGRKGKLTWYGVPNFGFPAHAEVRLPESAISALDGASDEERKGYKTLLDPQ
jgi:hypothetical protein